MPFDSIQATLSLTVSPADFKNDERRDLEENIEEKRIDIDTERYSVTVERDLQNKSVAMAEQLLESGRVEVEQARLSLKEAELLFEQGHLTELELEKAGLSVGAAEAQYLSAAAGLYKTLGGFLYLYGAL